MLQSQSTRPLWTSHWRSKFRARPRLLCCTCLRSRRRRPFGCSSRFRRCWFRCRRHRCRRRSRCCQCNRSHRHYRCCQCRRCYWCSRCCRCCQRCRCRFLAPPSVLPVPFLVPPVPPPPPLLLLPVLSAPPPPPSPLVPLPVPVPVPVQRCHLAKASCDRKLVSNHH